MYFINIHFMRNKMLHFLLVLVICIMQVVLYVSLLFCLLFFPVHIPFLCIQLDYISFYSQLYFISFFVFILCSTFL